MDVLAFVPWCFFYLHVWFIFYNYSLSSIYSCSFLLCRSLFYFRFREMSVGLLPLQLWLPSLLPTVSFFSVLFFKSHNITLLRLFVETVSLSEARKRTRIRSGYRCQKWMSRRAGSFFIRLRQHLFCATVQLTAARGRCPCFRLPKANHQTLLYFWQLVRGAVFSGTFLTNLL